MLAPPQRRQLQAWTRANETSSMRAGPAPWSAAADKAGSGDYGGTNDGGVAYGPAGQKAQNLRPLIGELTTLVIPELPAQAHFEGNTRFLG